MIVQAHDFIHQYLTGYWAYTPAIVALLLGFVTLVKSSDADSTAMFLITAFLLIWVGALLFIAV